MSDGLIFAGGAAVLMFCGAMLMFAIERRAYRRESIAQRLDDAVAYQRATRGGRYPAILEWAYRELQRAGLVRHPRQLVVVSAISAVVVAGAYLLKGWGGFLVVTGLICIGIYIFIQWQAASTRKMMVQQLPGFIDLVIRGLGIGRSFDSAFLQAIEDSPAPLSDALEIIKIENALGGNVADALQEIARIYKIKELHLLTLALRINQRYGGSIKGMLESIITLIRQREQAQRELSAMTGETRMTAWVFGLMPTAIAGYMMVTNPTYIGTLLQDPNGTEIIATALGLQLAGGFVLWRMMRSIQ